MADGCGGLTMARVKSSIWIPFKEYPNYANIYAKDSIQTELAMYRLFWRVGFQTSSSWACNTDGHPSFCDV